MKFIVFSDIHLHNYKQFNDRTDGRLLNIIGALDYVLRFARANDISHIFFAGDMFDLFGYIQVKTLLELYEWKVGVPKLSDVTLTYISGNHDMIEKTTSESDAAPRASTRLLPLLMPLNVRSLDHGDYTVIDHNHFMWGIPYFHYADIFERRLQSINDYIDKHQQDKHHYLMMHQDVWPDNEVIDSIIDPDDKRLDPFTLIFNGHIHQHGVYGNDDRFINVGNLLHRDAGDVGSRKGFLVVDTETNEWGFKDITDAFPQFIRIPYGQELTEWEQKQYVIRYHETKPVDKQEDPEKFRSDLDPKDLIKNYCKSVGVDDKKIIQTGINLLA